ncbi:MAG TPA: protein kinase [Kofleriaceae bacterium]|nr:protein kinase [Kofleriaceae bacterium]
MRPELDDTLAAGGSDPARTATAPRTRAGAAASDPGELVPGQQLGHFRIEKPLGAGGMGEVYLATDLALERPVAIKVLPAAVARDPARRDRLVREARAQARILHPNVGHIYFIGEDGGRLYFAMEYVAGETLSGRITAGPLPVDDALAIIRSAALGLREAQRNGITHRDIKPSNLMVDSHGMVKVLDFGLAATTERAELLAGLDGAPAAQTSFAGTPLYMAPEQARGEPVDFRADIYALGATLFHLVSGRPPFEADTLDGLLSKHSSAERPMLPRRPGQARTTIAAIAQLCGKMMAPAPADRFGSYDELIRAIELTSVEHIRPAGLWVRSMAAFVDFMLVSVAIAAIALPIKFLVFRDTNGSLDAFVLLLYPFYAAVLTARYGRTPGKSLFELEVIDVETGGRPSLRRAVIRTAVLSALPLAGVLVSRLLKLYGYELDESIEIAFVSAACAPPLLLVWASLRSVSKRTLWDKLSGTMVRYRTRRAAAI